jgi:hypothetical protein
VTGIVPHGRVDLGFACLVDQADHRVVDGCALFERLAAGVGDKAAINKILDVLQFTT